MGNKPLTRILEEILDVKLSPLKATIKELTKMAEFRKFIDEANKKYEETNTRQHWSRDLLVQVAYSRRECLEIHGIPLPPKERDIKENTNELVLKIGDMMGVSVRPEDILVSHRIPTCQKYQGRRSAPAIIVTFTRRDTKEMFSRGRKELRGLTTKDLGFSDDNIIFINESLTEVNKELFKATLKVKKDHSYDHIWTSNGRIYLRMDRDSSEELNKLKR
ncbi:uncharacterized protein [Montipora capricornis]|uniref:uncharacterized protein n=1 Tax=Montipora capricornis TaxID=246305 RepID=UPI0035F16FF2